MNSRDRLNGPSDDAREADNAGEARPDPTKMVNQPSLQQSKGAIWIIMGGLFLAMSLIPFGALIFAGSGRSATLATIIAATLIVLYAALVLARFVIARRLLRVRFMAVCMLSMAALALVGIWVCGLIENAVPISAG